MVLNAEHLTLQLPENGRTIFEDVSIGLEEHELGFISGGAGTGKTVLGLALCGYLPLWVGSWALTGGIAMDGRPIEQGMYTKEAGVILENPYIQLSGMKKTVFQELAFPLESRGVKPLTMPERILKYAMLLEVPHLLNRPIRALSGGELQRVLIAATLIIKPRFIFMDRPFTEIDMEFRPRLMNIITSHLHDNGGGALLTEDTWLLPDCRFDREISLGDQNENSTEQHTTEINDDTSRHDSGETVLELDSVTFGYPNGTPVLDEFSFTAGRGDIFMVTGRNGSGKTTLAKLIAGMLKPSGGRIIVKGQNIAESEQWEIVRDVGLALQDPSLHLCRRTVHEEFALAERWGTPSWRFTGPLGIDHLMDHHPLELSQAEKKRLGMALACGGNRDILILDEPTQYQDGAGFERMRSTIAALADEGRCILIISHDPRLFEAFPGAGIIHLSQEDKS